VLRSLGVETAERAFQRAMTELEELATKLETAEIPPAGAASTRCWSRATVRADLDQATLG
jgi:hypothetical protein